MPNDFGEWKRIRTERAGPMIREAVAVNAVYDIPRSGPSASYGPWVMTDEAEPMTLQAWNKQSSAAKDAYKSKAKRGKWKRAGKALIEGLKQSAADALAGPRNIGGTMSPDVPYNVPTVPPVYGDSGTPPNRRTAFPDADFGADISGDGWSVQFGDDANRSPFPWWLVLLLVLILLLVASKR